MKSPITVLALLSLMVPSCTSRVAPILPGASTVVKHGTSFGECAGYCRTDLTIEGLTATFRRTGWRIDPPLPAKETTATLSTDEWIAIMGSIDFTEFSKLDTVIGCPDCADGGAEWIEIIDPVHDMKVTFEFGKSLPYIQQLLDRVRAVEERFQPFRRNS